MTGESFTTAAQSTYEHFMTQIKKLRGSGATSQLLDDVLVEAYGTKMRISEVASIQAVDATLLTVSPWDKSLLQHIEKGVAAANLNLNPVVDGEIIRIAVPPLTQESRQQVVKELKTLLEEAKTMLRTARMKAKKDIETSADEDGVSEDDIKRRLKSLDEDMNDFSKKLEAVAQQKEEQLLKL